MGIAKSKDTIKQTLARYGAIRVVGVSHDTPVFVEHIVNERLSATFCCARKYGELIGFSLTPDTDMVYVLSPAEKDWLNSGTIERLVKEYLR